MTELLMDTALSLDQRSMCETVKISGELLLVVIKDVLDLSKVEAGKLLLEYLPFRVSDTFKAVEALMSPLAAGRNLTLEVNIDSNVPDWARGDSGRIKQITFNLIGNAIKFTREGKVTVDVTAVSAGDLEDGVRFLIRVRDTGIGMSKRTQARLFQPFMQADSSTTREVHYSFRSLSNSLVWRHRFGIVDLQELDSFDVRFVVG